MSESKVTWRRPDEVDREQIRTMRTVIVECECDDGTIDRKPAYAVRRGFELAWMGLTGWPINLPVLRWCELPEYTPTEEERDG